MDGCDIAKERACSFFALNFDQVPHFIEAVVFCGVEVCLLEWGIVGRECKQR